VNYFNSLFLILSIFIFFGCSKYKEHINLQNQSLFFNQNYINWSKKKYKFLINNRNILKKTSSFGKNYNKVYKINEFNYGFSFKIKKNSKISLPFTPIGVIFLKNWQGNLIIIEGKSTIIYLKTKKFRIYNRNNKWKKGDIIGIILSNNIKIIIYNSKKNLPIKPTSFFHI